MKTPQRSSQRASQRASKRASKEQRALLRAELYERADRGDLDLREALRLMRRIAGRTQAEYAAMVGVSARVLIEFERGIGNPTIRTVEKLVAPFGLELTFRRRRRRQAEPVPEP